MGKITVQFLGSGDAFGSGGRLQTCLFVESGQFRFLIDCGATSLAGMKRWGVSPDHIDAIVVSHLHGDHFGGIPFLLLDAHLVAKRTRHLVIAGPPGLEERLQKAQEVLFPGSSTMQPEFPLETIELAERTLTTVGPLEVTGYPVIHPSGAPSYALRIRCGDRVISYSGDTEWTDVLIKASDGADLFICEAYYFDKRIRFHLDYKTLADHRQDLGCKRLVITHMSENMLEKLGGVEIEAAEDGMAIAI